jgi:hypothetical protein
MVEGESERVWRTTPESGTYLRRKGDGGRCTKASEAGSAWSSNESSRLAASGVGGTTRESRSKTDTRRPPPSWAIDSESTGKRFPNIFREFSGSFYALFRGL